LRLLCVSRSQREEWISDAAQVNLAAALLDDMSRRDEQRAKCDRFISIVSRALVVYMFRNSLPDDERKKWLPHARALQIHSPSQWYQLGVMFTLMFPACLMQDETDPSKVAFRAGTQLMRHPVRFTGWSKDTWFRFSSAGKYNLSLFPAINQFMSTWQSIEGQNDPISPVLEIVSRALASQQEESSDCEMMSGDVDDLVFSGDDNDALTPTQVEDTYQSIDDGEQVLSDDEYEIAAEQ
jgi:hypothetical protein